jgi:benzodiazapine receptor
LALKQPPFRPPPWVFGPAWTVLYGLMGYSAYRAYNTGTNPLASAEKLLLTKQGATLYTVQLGLNLVVRALSTPVSNLLSLKTATNLSS